MYRNGRGRGPRGSGIAAGTVHTAQMGGAEEHSPEFGVPADGAGKTAEVVGQRARQVRGVDDRGARRQNSTIVRRVVR